MNQVVAGLVFALGVGFVLGWMLKPGPNSEQGSRSMSSRDLSNERDESPLSGGEQVSEGATSEYLLEIADLKAQLERLEPIRASSEEQHISRMNAARARNREFLAKIDEAVFLDPQQVAILKERLQVMEDIQNISNKRRFGLLTEEEASDQLDALPNAQFSRDDLLEVLSDDQRVLLEESEYQERREKNRKGAELAIERLTANIDINPNQELQLIEQHVDIRSGPSSDIANYISSEFADLQVADIVKAEISLASKVLTEDQLIEYVENHLKRY